MLVTYRQEELFASLEKEVAAVVEGNKRIRSQMHTHYQLQGLLAERVKNALAEIEQLKP